MIVSIADYEVLDNDLIRVRFSSPDPRPYSQSDFFVVITTTESTQNTTQLRTTLTTKLQAKYGNAVLDPASGLVKGQGVTSLNTLKPLTSTTPITVTT